MGRPATFDPDLALDRALDVFWRRGWAQTSIDDLVEATGVNRYSLYARWTDKRGLYLAALERYLQGVTSAWLEPLRTDADPAAAIRGTFHRLRDAVLSDAERRGCFALNTVLELHADAEMQSAIRRVLDHVQAVWRLALGRAAAAGQLRPDEDLDARAAHLAVSMQALLLQSRVAPPPATVQSFVDLTLGFLERP
jgi:TetR/AcrR family transcriptional repressor of nem operon